jgi:hypothetical protein
MAEVWPGLLLRAGDRVVAALALLVLGVLVFGVWAVWGERRRSQARRAAPAPAIDPTDLPEPPADASVQALQQTLRSLEHFERLQGDLRQRLQQTDQALEAEQDRVGSAVQLLKRAAQEMRLPETVFEVYEGLRLMPRKSSEAQQADRTWHRQVGIEPGRVLVLDADSRQTQMNFVLDGAAMRISGRSFMLSRGSFDELTLLDGGHSAVLTVRIKLSPDRLTVLECAVTGYRPGAWVEAWVALRTRMDERKAALQRGPRLRELDKLRSEFGIGAGQPGWRTTP